MGTQKANEKTASIYQTSEQDKNSECAYATRTQVFSRLQKVYFSSSASLRLAMFSQVKNERMFFHTANEVLSRSVCVHSS